MTCRRTISFALSATCIAGGVLLAATTMAGPEKISFPTGWEKWERYAVVDRHDTKQYRELFAKQEVVRAVRDGKPIPDGAVLVMAIYGAQLDDKGAPTKNADGRFMKGKPVGVTVMEKRKGWGAEYPAEMRNGDWEYASFTPDGKPNEKANAGIKACFMCHKPHEKQDFVMSLASLSGNYGMGSARKPAGPSSVAIAEFLFGPQKMSVKQGQTITWTNVDDSPHQVTVQGQTEYRSPVLLKGQTTSLTFAHAGTYDYICGLHPGMRGSVEVTQ